MQGSFTMLGSGASMGVPVVGCDCAVCTSLDPKNKRFRPSGLLEVGGKIILVDVGPDFRDQALARSLNHLDGMLLTHTHFDHIAGLDELRIFYFKTKRPLPCLLSVESYEDLEKRYYYLFKPKLHASNYTAQLDFQLLPQERGRVDFLGLDIGYFSFAQGGMKVTGYRLGEFAYVSDIADYPETIFEDLRGVKKLILSALRFSPSHVHFTLDQAVQFSERVGADETWLTHIAHEVDHEKANAYLPPKVRVGYDGLHFTFQSTAEVNS